MTATITVSHNFETAHRLPHLPGKCVSLHGHSWWTDITVTAPEPDTDGVVIEFGAFKKALRAWIDEHLDHGVMLGSGDPLLGPLLDSGTKVFLVPGWPTVENVARLLADVATELLASVPHVDGAQVAHVEVQETRVNRAGWRAA